MLTFTSIDYARPLDIREGSLLMSVSEVPVRAIQQRPHPERRARSASSLARRPYPTPQG